MPKETRKSRSHSGGRAKKGKRKKSPKKRSTSLVQIPVSMYQTVVTSLAQGNRPVQVAMAPVTTRIDNTVTLDGQAVEVVTLEQ
ncbi:hypothetical protein SKAU_G00036490 [Synaphobranchus kaupii]|uniref:Uncharacterized protein n=1 Tax=Synaphobranchus kaupii TaxID=118154 RepID=A0A9Q1JDP5_SYNKA|nr:hypothetical protein SKAU_G00036490 [Synaphobranchus kaupii]